MANRTDTDLGVEQVTSKPRTVRSVRQAELKRLLGAGYHDDDWAFCRADGTTFHPERFSREFLRKQEAYNKTYPDEQLPRMKLHGLRHTRATLALEEGIDIHVVSERFAHSSTHITSEIYTHVTRPMQSDAADRVAARILGVDWPQESIDKRTINAMSATIVGPASLTQGKEPDES